MFSIAEKWNRRVTFAAARELALAQPNNKYVQEILPSYRDELAKMMRRASRNMRPRRYWLRVML